MAGEAFTRVFWDILADIVEPVRLCDVVARGMRVEQANAAVVIEDDADIRALVSDVLEQAGFEVHAAGAGLDGIELVNLHDPIVVTIDVSMPGMDGFETAKRIRAASSAYIIMLTARSDEADTLQGLLSGADDYVTKPFRPRELRARVEAMQRRPRAMVTHPAAPAGSVQEDPVEDGWIAHRGLRANLDMRIAVLDDAELELTRSEFDILYDLLTAGRRVVRKADLALLLRDDRHPGALDFVSEHDLRAIEVHIANLRRKLGDSASQPQWIETIRGVGYRLATP